MLSKTAIKAIHGSVDDLFDNLLVRLIGPQLFPKTVKIGFIKDFSLPGLYEAAAQDEDHHGSDQTLANLLEVSQSYVEAYRDIAKARVVKEVQSFLADTERKGIKTDVETVLGGKLSEVWRDVSESVDQIVEAEANTAKNMGAMEGIAKIASLNGIDDPVVFFVVVRDENLCDECKRLHLMGDMHTPRLWYMSEVGSGYHKKGQDNPKLGGLHPRCRCSLTSMPSGYGFDAGGMIEYKSPGYDAMAVQRK